MMAVACAGSGLKDPVASQEDHHGAESDALVAVDKGMVFGKPERIGRSEFGHFGLSVTAIG